MVEESGIVITGIGCVSSVGLNVIQTCASMRAGVSRFQEWESYYCLQEDLDSEEPELLICAPVPAINTGADRVLNLMMAAVKDLIKNARLTRDDLSNSGIYISLPSDARPQDNADRLKRLLPEFYSRTGIAPVEESRTFGTGHAGGFLAMQEAMSMLHKGQKQFCIVVGVDSYLDIETLTWLDESDRIKTKRIQDGFIPGEAAAALLLETHSHAAGRKASVFAAIDKIGVARETNTIGSDKPSTGQGLCEAIKKACTPDDRVKTFDWVVCDLNGESYRAREWGYCQVKLRDMLGAVKDLWHPADCGGDVGAASGTMIAALVARAFQKGYAPSGRSLLWTSSDNGERAAVVLKKG